MAAERRIFISYSSKELEIAAKVCDYLERNGILCWIAPRNVDAGGNYASQIVRAIKQSDILVLLASRSTNASGHVSNEVSIAFDNKKTIIPFKLQDFEFTDEYLYFLGRKHWIETHGDINAGLEKLRATVLSVIGEQAAPTAAVPQEPLFRARPAAPAEPAPTEERQGSRHTRESIVASLIAGCEKYPYYLYKKVNTPERYENFLQHALVMFSETVSVYRYNKCLSDCENIIDLLVENLSGEAECCVQVQGLPGGAKNMILQLVFYKMLENFRTGKSDALPFYLSASYYEKIPYNPDNVYGQMKDVIGKDCREYFAYLQENPTVRPVLLIEAIREHNVARFSPENAVAELWSRYKKFNRACAIDVGLIKNRARLKRVIPIAGDAKGYTLVVNQIPIDDKNACLRLIGSVFAMYGYDLDPQEAYSFLRAMQYPAVDIFLVRLIATETISVYNRDDIRLTDIYEKFALSELYGDAEQLKKVSRELTAYVFDQSYTLPSTGYNAAMWSLPHKHNTYLEFLIAYYFVYRIEHYKEYSEHRFFAIVLTAMSNHFVVSFLKENYTLQEILLHFILENYESFDMQQKVNAVYWLGRITFKNLAGEAVELLTREFDRMLPLVKTNNRSTQENYDNHFMFRSVCIGLLYQSKMKAMDEYLCVVVTNDIANAINRGATIEYFGDNYQMVAHDSYYLDSDLNLGEQAIKILISRIENALTGNTGKFVENNLVTLLTLLQSRIQNDRTVLKYDVRPYVSKAMELLSLYRKRPQNIVSSKLMYYFQSVEEDFRYYLDHARFDIGPIIYNRYRQLKQVKRTQWLKHDIYDPESVAEHSYSAWMLAMFFLPEELQMEGYCKREVLDMLLIHDMAEAAVGDARTSLSEQKKELKEQNDVLRKLFLKGTYPDIANLSYYYNIWTGYYNGINANAKVARDINLLQSVYTFCEYYCTFPDHFTKQDAAAWIREKNNLKTEVGYQLFERLILKNNDFRRLFEEIEM